MSKGTTMRWKLLTCFLLAAIAIWMTMGVVVNSALNASLTELGNLTLTASRVPWMDATGHWALAVPSTADDTAYSSAYNGVSTKVPSQNAIYDYLHLGDTNDDGYPDALGATFSKTFVLNNPTTACDKPCWRTPHAITILAVHVLCLDGTSWVGHVDEFDGNGLNAAVVDSADITGTAGTTVNDDGTLSNAAIDPGDYVGVHTTAVNGAVTLVLVTIDYKEH
jgi:hypothetical protein